MINRKTSSLCIRADTPEPSLLAHTKARICLLVDLREFFCRFRVGGTKKKIKKL